MPIPSIPPQAPSGEEDPGRPGGPGPAWSSPLLPAPLSAGGALPRGLALHAVLAVSTFGTMLFAGAVNSAAMVPMGRDAAAEVLRDPGLLLLGLPYTLCLMAILGVHEMGHYLACRRYGVDASLPYFLPNPFPIMGTFGAFIRIRAPIPDRRALFDIGVAGPLAGFAVALPVILFGLLHVESVPADTAGPSERVGIPLLLAWLMSVIPPSWPEGEIPLLSGPLMAGWVGCLATAINLFPIGQLDGGHICFALSARVHAVASFVTLAAFVGLGLLVYPGWLFFATLLILVGPRHPAVSHPAADPGAGRIAVAVLALAILVLCFIPRPIS
ncbi:MAG TPA: site-2 protease family protein [Candidatus Polarisedimenticolia bacterium]|nr:site-2 protease family protein [Candidatus Polarisedimenticolia bacterium]